MGAKICHGSGIGLGVAHHHEEAEVGIGEEMNARIARAVTAIYRGICGRGPTTARAMCQRNVVVVVLEEVRTQAERSLVARDRCDEALALRRELHGAMRDELALAVSQLTRCPVHAVMGDAQLEPDFAVEVFLLDRVVDLTPLATQAR